MHHALGESLVINKALNAIDHGFTMQCYVHMFSTQLSPCVVHLKQTDSSDLSSNTCNPLDY